MYVLEQLLEPAFRYILTGMFYFATEYLFAGGGSSSSVGGGSSSSSVLPPQSSYSPSLAPQQSILTSNQFPINSPFYMANHMGGGSVQSNTAVNRPHSAPPSALMTTQHSNHGSNSQQPLYQQSQTQTTGVHNHILNEPTDTYQSDDNTPYPSTGK